MCVPEKAGERSIKHLINSIEKNADTGNGTCVFLYKGICENQDKISVFWMKNEFKVVEITVGIMIVLIIINIMRLCRLKRSFETGHADVLFHIITK